MSLIDMTGVRRQMAYNSSNQEFVCRRCAVFKPVETVTFKGATTGESQELAFKHLVEFHPDRAVKLLSLLGNLLMVTNEYVWSALRDHNSEGDFNIMNIRADYQRHLTDEMTKEIAKHVENTIKEK